MDHKVDFLYPDGLREYFNPIKNIGIVFETCNSGGFCTETDETKGLMTLFLDEGGIDGDEQIILMSSRSELPTYENIDAYQYSFFTLCFLEAFTTPQGREVANIVGSDDRISLEEAFKYAHDFCINHGWYKDDNNYPVISDKYEGEFYFSDSKINNLWIVSANSHIHLHAYDSQGRHTGFNNETVFESEIPGSYYSGPVDGEMIIFFDPSLFDNVNIEVEAIEEGEFDLTLGQFIKGEMNSKTFRDIPITEDSIGYIKMSHEGIPNILSLDRDGDGIIDEYIESSGLPFAEFFYTPNFLTVNETITFDASHSVDLDGTIESWEWNFGDGDTGEGEIITHNYTSPGSYNP